MGRKLYEIITQNIGLWWVIPLGFLLGFIAPWVAFTLAWTQDKVDEILP